MEQNPPEGGDVLRNEMGSSLPPSSSSSQYLSLYPSILNIPPEEDWVPSSDGIGDDIHNNHPFVYPQGDYGSERHIVPIDSDSARESNDTNHSPSTNYVKDFMQQVSNQQTPHMVNAYNGTIGTMESSGSSSKAETPKSRNEDDTCTMNPTPPPPPPHMPGAHPGVAVGYPMLYPLYNMEMKNLNLRRGKWTEEEEAYTNKIIEAFNEGTLVLPGMEGVTLRAFLANKLQCDPMRITKKFTGASCLGKRVYHSSSIKNGADAEVFETTREIEELERRFRLKLKESRVKSSDTSSDINVPSPTSIQQQFPMRNTVVHPWGMVPNQAAVMQQYMTYTRNLPLNAYVQATQSHQPASTMMGSHLSVSDTTSLDANNNSSSDNSNGNTNSDHSSDKSNESNESNSDEDGAARKKVADSSSQPLQQKQPDQQFQQQQFQQQQFQQQQFQQQQFQQQQQAANCANPMLGTQGYDNAYLDIIMRHLMMQQQQQQMTQGKMMAMGQTPCVGDQQQPSADVFPQMSPDDAYAEHQQMLEHTMQYNYAMAMAAAGAAANGGMMNTNAMNPMNHHPLNLVSDSSPDGNGDSVKRSRNDDSAAVTLDDESAAASLLGLHSTM